MFFRSSNQRAAAAPAQVAAAGPSSGLAGFDPQVEAVQRAHRTTFMVVGHDPKTMLVESKTGNLRKALKAAKT